MVYKFENVGLTDNLKKLGPNRRAAFAAACAQRILPGYGRFAADRPPRGRETLEGALAALWEDLMGSSMSDEDLRSKKEACEAELPGEEGEGEWGPLAEDAVAAVVYALECREQGSSESAALSARRAYEAVDYLVTYDEVGRVVKSDEAALADPVVQAELARQARDLEELGRESGEEETDLFGRIRERAIADAASVFGQDVD
jgi:hypothetical protein